MLQLPQSSPTARRFSKKEIADISRGATVRRRPSKSNIISLVALADKALDQYTDACNDVFIALHKLPQADRTVMPFVDVPEDLKRVWVSDFKFSSEKHIRRQFRAALKRERFVHRTEKAKLKKVWTWNGAEQIKREIEQRLPSYERNIAALLKQEDVVVRAFRKESRRLHVLQKKAGLLVAREKRRAAWLQLVRLTAKMAEAKPTTLSEAIAVVAYVENRSWCEKPALFAMEGDLPGNFGPLLRHALKIIQKGMI